MNEVHRKIPDLEVIDILASAPLIEPGRLMKQWLWVVIQYGNDLYAYRAVPIYDQSVDRLHVESIFSSADLAVHKYQRQIDQYGVDWWIVLGRDQTDATYEVRVLEYKDHILHGYHKIVRCLLREQGAGEFDQPIDNSDCHILFDEYPVTLG